MPKMINTNGFTLSDFASTSDAAKLTNVSSETIRRNSHKIRYVMVGKTHAWLKEDLVRVFNEERVDGLGKTAVAKKKTGLQDFLKWKLENDY